VAAVAAQEHGDRCGRDVEDQRVADEGGVSVLVGERRERSERGAEDRQPARVEQERSAGSARQDRLHVAIFG